MASAIERGPTVRREDPGCSDFDGARLRVLLEELDDELTPDDLSEPCRIVIVGGAAVALRVPNRVTVDVDVVSEGMPMALRFAAERVAARHGLRADWVNDGAKAKTVAVRAEPEVVFEGANLIVEAASPRYLLAMKLTSARRVDRDDCVMLAQILGIDNADVLLDLIEEALPQGALRTVTMRYFAEEVAREAVARGVGQRQGFWQALRRWVRSLVRRRAQDQTTAGTDQRPVVLGKCGARNTSKGGRCSHPHPGRGGRCAAGHKH